MNYNLVRYYRKELGIRKIELARMTRLTPRVIHNIESNPEHNPSRDTMIRISNSLGIPPSIIFFPQEEMEKRQIFANMILFCMDMLKISKQDVIKRLSDMSKFSEEKNAS